MPGTNTGLSLARRFVEVESQTGKGTHVVMKLPMSVSDSRASEMVRDHGDFNAQVIALAHLRVSVTGFSTANTDWKR